MKTYTAAEKHAAVTRELGYRRRVYPRWVEAGRMRQDQADAQIAVFEAIAADYAKQLNEERAKADLFGGAA